MKINYPKIRYFLSNWKMIIFLLFRTKRFGVMNKWWWPDKQGTIFHIPWWNYKKWRIIHNYKMARRRAAPGIGFIPEEEYRLIFEEPWYRRGINK